jgi:hypothetical protein
MNLQARWFFALVELQGHISFYQSKFPSSEARKSQIVNLAGPADSLAATVALSYAGVGGSSQHATPPQ